MSNGDRNGMKITMMKNAVCYSCLHSKDIAKECPNNGICLIRQKLKDMYTNNIKGDV